jgi:hypothetical protein
METCSDRQVIYHFDDNGYGNLLDERIEGIVLAVSNQEAEVQYTLTATVHDTMQSIKRYQPTAVFVRYRGSIGLRDGDFDLERRISLY